ncbi:hypothetical protein BKA69DRAFT_1073042 [Paraphysoderma sedebokerense]|nr:hypothetical protein BKA69DRAFT_1073042 [Paraphysoderma sedebokerense]
MAVILQSAYKGHVSRNEAATYLCWRAKEDRIHHYNEMATNIQRIWRGYLSRKLELDYYKRKNYIAEIKTRVGKFSLKSCFSSLILGFCIY